ncbi:MAG: cytochrome c oxidase subunit 3 [Acidimicrobiia bacterium]|nr:cytochrome c oxidase subunit 3 [Acidimicrobiia bacterium]
MTAESPPVNSLPDVTSGPRSYAWWGMVWLILTESALFAMLIFSYFYLRFREPTWPPDGIDLPALMLPLIMGVILWSSSIPVHLAARGIKAGSQTRLRWGLLIGFILGTAFLILQLFIEYPQTWQEFTPQTNAYGSLFYTITGFHGFHVFIGLSISLWVQVRAWGGAFSAQRHVGVQSFALYWHFVDVAWLFILLTLYISPYL